MVEDEPRETVQLKNSDFLQHLDKKLQHLPDGERKAVTELVREFVAVFPDVPCRTTLVCHDVDVGDAHPIKQHQYKLHPEKLAALKKEVWYCGT